MAKDINLDKSEILKKHVNSWAIACPRWRIATKVDEDVYVDPREMKNLPTNSERMYIVYHISTLSPSHCISLSRVILIPLLEAFDMFHSYTILFKPLFSFFLFRFHVIRIGTRQNPLAANMILRERNTEYQDMYFLLCTEFSKAEIEKGITAAKAGKYGWEHALCHIRSYNDGSFEMRPGFSAASQHEKGVIDPKEWYSITTPVTKTRLLYRIENESDGKGVAAAKMASLRRTKQILVKDDDRKVSKGAGFQRAPLPMFQRVNWFGEIVRARCFQETSIFVSYEIWVPGHWRWSKGDPYRRFRSTTHVAQVYVNPRVASFRATEDDLHANFSHPYECEFLFQPGAQDATAPGGQWPMLYVEVMAKDLLGTTRIVGYGYTPLPETSGTQTVSVPTWVPVASIRDQLHRFYIGGAPMLRDPKLAGIPAEFQGSFLNKYGLRTQSAGYVDIRINSVMQRGLQSEQYAKASPTNIHALDVNAHALVQ